MFNPELTRGSDPGVRPGTHQTPRRAGVSSFGMGGTNVHVVLEQAPETEPGSRTSGPYLMTLSARTPAALAAARNRLAAHLRAHPDLEIADVAWTLQVGRATLEQREAICCAFKLDGAMSTAAMLPVSTASTSLACGRIVYLPRPMNSEITFCVRMVSRLNTAVWLVNGGTPIVLIETGKNEPWPARV